MNEYVKHEKNSEETAQKQAKLKSTLLQTYFTSLLCLVLCVTMFFGTTYAWFTSEVSSTDNEIYIGILDVDLQMNGASLGESNAKVFDNTIRWEPGYTALRSLTVVNEGDLAFNYTLHFTDGAAKDAENNEANLEAVANHFAVWVYSGSYSKTEGETFADMTAKEGWTNVGTLAEVLNGKAVFSGGMTKDDVVDQSGAKKDTTHTYTIALHMSESTENATDANGKNSLMGKSVSLNVKLTAYQMGSEKDGFNNSSYDNVCFASTEKELQDALDNASGNVIIQLTDDVAGELTVTQKENVRITVDGGGKTFNGSLVVDGRSAAVDTAALTIRNVNFAGLTGKDSVYIHLGVAGDSNTRYTNNVTVQDCTFRGTGEVTAAIKSYTGGDKNLTVTGCTVDEGMHSLVQVANVENVLIKNCKVNSKNGANFNQSGKVTVSGCSFEVKGYAVRFGASSGGTGAAESYLIENCTLRSACEAEDDAVIILRGTADNATLTLVNNTVEGKTKIVNNAADAKVEEK